MWQALGKTLTWDEVDYVNAASLGIASNAMELGSLGPAEFVAFARAKLTGEPPKLPPSYDEARDPLLLRHYHPPLVIYLTAMISNATPTPDERGFRGAQLVGAIVFSGALVWAYVLIGRSVRWPGLLLLLLLSCWMVLVSFQTLHFHGWAAVWVVAASAAAVRAKSSPRVWAPLFGVLMGLGLITLEALLAVWVGLVASLLLCRGLSLRDARLALKSHVVPSLVATAFTVLVLWPGSVLGASLLKIPALSFYRSSQGQIQADLLATGPGLLLAVAPAAWLVLPTLWWLWRDRSGRIADVHPLAVVGILYLAALLYVRLPFSPLHVVPALAPFVVLAALMADRSRQLTRLGVILATAVLISATSSAWRPTAEDPLRDDLRVLPGLLKDRVALVDGAHVLRFYLGEGPDLRPILPSFSGREILERRSGEYHELDRAALDDRIVLIQMGNGHLRPLETTLLANCRRTDLRAYRAYDCAPTSP